VIPRTPLVHHEHASFAISGLPRLRGKTDEGPKRLHPLPAATSCGRRFPYSLEDDATRLEARKPAQMISKRHATSSPHAEPQNEFSAGELSSNSERSIALDEQRRHFRALLHADGALRWKC
jgi:hypothetical protein